MHENTRAVGIENEVTSLSIEGMDIHSRRMTRPSIHSDIVSFKDTFVFPIPGVDTTGLSRDAHESVSDVHFNLISCATTTVDDCFPTATSNLLP